MWFLLAIAICQMGVFELAGLTTDHPLVYLEPDHRATSGSIAKNELYWPLLEVYGGIIPAGFLEWQNHFCTAIERG
jgi:hypothetical protein